MSDHELGTSVLQQAFDLWITPEVVRRQERGDLPVPFEIVAAQIVINVGARPVVRLNEEVRVLAWIRVDRAVKAGEMGRYEDLGRMEAVELTDADPNAGHITLIRYEGQWFIQFDFRYNAQRVGEVLEAAAEFLASARESLAAGRLRAFTDTLFSAVELMAKALLLPLPDEALLTSKKHNYVAARFSRSVRHGEAREEHLKLFNRLSNLRYPARYLDRPLALSVDEAAEMLKTADDMFATVNQHAPVRGIPPTPRNANDTRRPVRDPA